MKAQAEERKKLHLFEKNFGYSFKNKDLLKRALTHKSYTNEQQLSPLNHNERSEYLGDAVLELSISHLLMERFKTRPEGELSKFRAAVVNESQLYELAKEVDLGEYLFLGKGEEQSGGRDKPSLLSDAYEAVLGGIYLDRGFKKAFQVIERHFAEAIERVGSKGFERDYKTRLQEKVQGRFKVTPRYKMTKAVGPDHEKTFEIHLYVRETLLGVGHGPSKKSAEQKAARQALKELEKEGA